MHTDYATTGHIFFCLSLDLEFNLFIIKEYYRLERNDGFSEKYLMKLKAGFLANFLIFFFCLYEFAALVVSATEISPEW